MIGYRLRLHIDSYNECYDFWVNADSPDIRPAGWCESTGRKLHPPKGMGMGHRLYSVVNVSAMFPMADGEPAFFFFPLFLL